MADFKQVNSITAINEGGYTNDPDDNGNWTGAKVGSGVLIGTKYGVSAPVLKAYLKRMPTVEDMLHLPIEAAHDIFRKNYWMPIRGDEIENNDIASQVYDSAINMGVVTAIILAQRALRIKETGIMDDTTLNKLNNK